MQLITYTGIESVNHDLWHQLTADKAFASVDWCRYGEAVLGSPAHYVLICDGDRPIGGAIYWVMYQDDFPIEDRRVRRVFDWYVKRHPLLVARTAIRTDSRGLFLPDDPLLANRVLRLLLDEAKRLLNDHQGSFFVVDYLEQEELDLDWQNFIKLHNFLEVGTKLELPYETYDAYLMATKARKKRDWKTIKHNTRKAHDRGLSVRIERTPPSRDIMVNMLHQQREKYDALNPNNYERAVFEHSAMSDEMRWIKIFQDETELVGAELAFICKQTGVYYPGLFGRYADVDYVYFLAYYTAIQHAIENGATVMIGNSGSEHFKVRLGFIADKRNNIVFYPRSSFARWLASLIVRVIRAQPDVSTATPPDDLPES